MPIVEPQFSPDEKIFFEIRILPPQPMPNMFKFKKDGVGGASYPEVLQVPWWKGRLNCGACALPFESHSCFPGPDSLKIKAGTF